MESMKEVLLVNHAMFDVMHLICSHSTFHMMFTI